MSEENAGAKKRQGERNPGASIQQRLRNRAKTTGEDAALLLIRYINERFLYRLSVSPYRDRFVLRGATLFSIWTPGPHRATRDIDLLASGDNAPEAMRDIIIRVCQEPVQGDGVAFLTETLNIEERSAERIYPGLHIEMTAALGTSRPRLEIDIAFGEAALPPTPRGDAFHAARYARSASAGLSEGDGDCGEMPGTGSSGGTQHPDERFLRFVVSESRLFL